ncbi:TonB-dependent receptor [Nitrospirillum iridis]|uniref:Iron complex outermembrane receptor protein n=1 Tax=Nitrospirillum iridis TaxID=765888 RepID=A0A7X0ECM8_9PROT|nr:TonB-dependent receptor [Nitrospirillum iridis]MBB6250126.1 iron complex outermembrane receptor protein [Nitrospirillum iridis]
MHRIVRPATAVVALMLAPGAIGITTTASAQTTAPAPQAGGGAQGQAAQLDEIVITAERREQSLQTAPVAVSALGGATLKEAGVADVSDLTRSVPSVVIAPAAGGVPQVYVRGVGTFASNAYAEQSVAVNLDGIYISRPAGANGFFYDLQRVEVLKGPQGTLYGRNASGGALNVLPETPKLGEQSATATLDIGNYDLRKGDAAVNVPLGDKAALRASGMVIDRKGYLTDGYNDDQGQAGRLQLLLEPTEDWRVRLSGDYYHRGGKGSGQVQYPYVDTDNPWIGPSDARAVAAYYAGLPAASAHSPLIQNAKKDGFIDDQFWGTHAEISHDFSFATLTIIPAYREVKEDYLSYIPSAFRVNSESQQRSVEARLASRDSGPLTWLAGAYYFSEDVDAKQDYNHWVQETVMNSKLTDETVAAFGQLTYALTDALRLTAGGRVTHEEKSQDSQFGTATFSPTKPALSSRADDRIWNAATWKVGVDYDLAPQSLLYANVGTGFKAGGFYASAGADTFNPEHLTAYSLGLKNRFWDNRVQLNLEAFDYEYRDQQISYLAPTLTGVSSFPYAPSFVTQNVGRSRIRGFEIEGRWKATSSDLLTATVQYTDTRYTSFTYNYFSNFGAPPSVGCPYTNASGTASPTPVAPSAIYSVNCSGKPATNAPRWTANIGYEHEFAFADGSGLTAAADVYLSASYYTAYDYLAEQVQGGYHMTNLRLTYNAANDRWSVTGYVNNVENQAVVNTSYQPNQAFGNGLNFANIRPPRTYGVRATVRY